MYRNQLYKMDQVKGIAVWKEINEETGAVQWFVDDSHGDDLYGPFASKEDALYLFRKLRMGLL